MRLMLTTLDLWEGRGRRHVVVYIETISRHRDRRSRGYLLGLRFSKKSDLSLFSIEGRVLDRCRAFVRLASVDAHLWLYLSRSRVSVAG